MVEAFARNRNWLDKYMEHSIALSLFTELGELAEVLQWQNSSTPVAALLDEIFNNFAMELADVFIYLFHFCRVCNVEKASL